LIVNICQNAVFLCELGGVFLCNDGELGARAA
jgi:hypothetical protein